jgi:hypothetical protein
MRNKEEQNSRLHHKAAGQTASQPAAVSLEAYISQLQKELMELRKAYSRLEYEKNVFRKAMLAYHRTVEKEAELHHSLTL